MLALALLVSGGAAADDRTGACKAANNEAVMAARAGLRSAPQSLPARLKLADALVEASCYDEAVHTLEDGESLHPRNAELQAKLRNARSFVSEQVYFEGKDQAEQAARLSRFLLRCNRLGDIEACDEALKLKPADADIHVAKGDALIKLSRLAEAEQAYRRARQVSPDHVRAGTQLAAVQAQHQQALSQCEKGAGEDALKACQTVLVPGASNAFAIQARLGYLHQQRNQVAPALAAYIAANTLKPGDRGIAAGIVALTDAGLRDDAVALSARGSALLTLNRNGEALSALREAQALAPDLPGLRPLLARAQDLAGNVTSDRAAARTVASAGSAQVAKATRQFSNAAEPSRSH
jgi:tetratricopeptide (TPR) repeat protein